MFNSRYSANQFAQQPSQGRYLQPQPFRRFAFGAHNPEENKAAYARVDLASKAAMYGDLSAIEQSTSHYSSATYARKKPAADW